MFTPGIFNVYCMAFGIVFESTGRRNGFANDGNATSTILDPLL